MTTTNESNSNSNIVATITLDLTSEWLPGKIDIGKKLPSGKTDEAGKAVQEVYPAGTIDYWFPVPFTGAAYTEGKSGEPPTYTDASVQAIYSALLYKVQSMAKTAYKVVGNDKDSLSLESIEGREVPKGWDDLSGNRVRFFALRGLLGKWRRAFGAYLAAIGKTPAVQVIALEPFGADDALSMASHYRMQDAAKRQNRKALTDAFHALLAESQPDSAAELAPAIELVNSAYVLAESLGATEEEDTEL